MRENYFLLQAQLNDGSWQTRERFEMGQRQRAIGAARDLMTNHNVFRLVVVHRVDGGGDLDRIFWLLPDGTEGK